MSEYESGRHEGVRRSLELAKKTLASITERKERATAGPVCAESTFQYGSGMQAGVREVLRHLEELAEELRLHELKRERVAGDVVVEVPLPETCPICGGVCDAETARLARNGLAVVPGSELAERFNVQSTTIVGFSKPPRRRPS